MSRAIMATLAACILAVTGCLASDHYVAPAPIIGEDHPEPKKDNRVLVVFGAGWCKYCQYLKSDMKELDLSGLEVRFVDVDENPELKEKNNVGSLPTSIMFENDKEVARKTGYDKKEYSKWLKQNKKK